MASESIGQAVRLPDSLGWRRAGLLVTSGLLLLSVYVLVRATGGAPSPLEHFAYLAIALAAVSGGWRGGLLAGVAAGLLVGPLMPDSSVAPVSDLWHWGPALRLGAFVSAGAVIGVFWDRSQGLAASVALRAAEARGAAVLRTSEERLRHTVEATADGLLVFDATGRLALVNAPAEQLLGKTRNELLGATYDEIAALVGLEVRGAAHLRAAGRSLPPVLATLPGPDGTQRSVHVSMRPLDADGSPGGLVFNLHEVTADRALARERAAHLAGLEAAALAAAGAPSAVAAGEALLAKIARIRPVVTAAIYLFDEEGTQRLTVWTAPEAGDPTPPLLTTELAGELRALAAQGPLRTELTRLPPGSGAAASLAQRGAHALLVLPLGDGGDIIGTLLAAERGGPEPLSPDEEAYLQAIGALATGIVRRAIEDEEAAHRRDHERVANILAQPTLLVPHFQPILALADRRVVGYEALARFHTQPVQPPPAWFARADALGLGAELQALAIERACSVARQAGLPAGAFLSLNVSPRHLASSPVAAALGGGSLERLVIEVTEEEAVADYDALRDAMVHYVGRGARVAVDDAGAGYASLRHVTELRPDFVKLDAELIRGLRDDTARQALVRALVQFTAAIEAVPIAEGVETPADLALLARTRQPFLVQGYAVARPGLAWPTVELAALGSRAARRRRTQLSLRAQSGGH